MFINIYSAYRLGARRNHLPGRKQRESVLSVGTEEDIKGRGAVRRRASRQLRLIVPGPRPEVTKGLPRESEPDAQPVYNRQLRQTRYMRGFISTGKAEDVLLVESTARLVSIALRAKIPLMIYAQLKGIRCPSTVRVQGLNCTSCPDAIAK